MQLNFGIILMALLFCCVNSCPGSRRRPGMYTAMLYTIYISPKIVQCSGITYLNLDSSGSNPNERGLETDNATPPPKPVVTQPKIPCCPSTDPSNAGQPQFYQPPKQNCNPQCPCCPPVQGGPNLNPNPIPTVKLNPGFDCLQCNQPPQPCLIPPCHVIQPQPQPQPHPQPQPQPQPQPKPKPKPKPQPLPCLNPPCQVPQPPPKPPSTTSTTTTLPTPAPVKFEKKGRIVGINLKTGMKGMSKNWLGVRICCGQEYM